MHEAPQIPQKPQRITNATIVTLFKEALAAMEVKNYNWFKIRAYQNAISVIENLTSSVQDMWEDGRIKEIPGIGEGIAAHLNELFTRGEVSEWEYTKKGLPDGMFVLLGLRGIGAKKAFKLANAFKLVNRDTAMQELKAYAEQGAIQELEGFGEKSEKDILEAVNEQKKTKNEKPRILLVKAEEIVDRLITYVKKHPAVQNVEALGSFRRRSATIGDLDLVVATTQPAKVIEHFVNYPEVAEILTKGERKVIVVLSNDVQVDLNVTKPEAYGAMVQYNTGSKQHNILLRQYALEKGMSLSEYGIKKAGKLYEYADERDFYHAVGVEYIAPELRNGTNEVELAKAKKLPKLVNLGDIKGDVQTHTIFSDGLNTLEEMVNAAIDLGYEYYGVTDHAPSIQARGEKEVERLLLEQRKLINEINEKQDKIKVLFGLEVNITADNEIALPDELLAMLDFSLGSIHTAMNQDRDTITERYITAIKNPYITFIGHPSGRLINERDAMDVDWKLVFEALLDYGKFIEINAQPNRLDLADDLVKVAISKGIKLLINTDAHATNQLAHMRYGVDVARRGFCETKDILNTLSYKEFVKILKKR